MWRERLGWGKVEATYARRSMGPRLEVACRRFAVLSGIRQEPDTYISCVLPGAATGQRKGLLALVTEPAGEHPALATDACHLVHDVILRDYYTDHSLSLTSSLLKALDSANSAMLQYNYQDEHPLQIDSRPGIMALSVQTGSVRTRGAQVGLTAVLLHPDGVGAYIAQMSPTQAYMVHSGLLSALPEPRGWQPRPGKVEVMLKRV